MSTTTGPSGDELGGGGDAAAAAAAEAAVGLPPERAAPRLLARAKGVSNWREKVDPGEVGRAGPRGEARSG